MKELEERLRAAGGETRKSLRERVARLSKENKDLTESNKTLSAQLAGLQAKLAEKSGAEQQPAST